jgi:hypothetical protein
MCGTFRLITRIDGAELAGALWILVHLGYIVRFLAAAVRAVKRLAS